MNAALRRVGFGLGLAVVAIALLLMRGDGPPPDDADLMALPAPVADHENGFLTLSAAAELVHWPADEVEDARWTRLARGEDWDEALAARAVADNARALEAFARVTRAPAFQTPPLHDIRVDALPDMRTWLRLARLSAIRAIASAKAGDQAAAIADALLALGVAHLAAGNGNATAFHATVSQDIGAAGLGALDVALPHLALDAARSREVGAQLAALRTDAGAWKRMWAGEYRAMKSTVTACCTREQAREIAAEHGAPAVTARLPLSYLYQPNNSLKAYAARIRVRQAQADEPCVPEATTGDGPSAFSLLLPNYLGKLRTARTAQLAWFDARRCHYDTRIEAMRAAIALRAFERERGALPPSLEALVPTYLETAPRDWFSESALRLDRAGRVIYSVGSDRRDEGGRALEGDEDLREPRFPLGEASAPPETARPPVQGGADAPQSQPSPM